MPTPPVPTFSINGHTYEDADFEQENMPATMSQLAADLEAVAAGAIIAGGYLSKAIAGDTTLSSVEDDNRVFNFSCSLAATATITFPTGFVGLALIINTNVSGAQSIVITQGGSTVTVATGTLALVYGDGTNFAAALGIVQTATGSAVSGTLSVSGNATISGAATVVGAVSVGGALNVTGDASFAADLDVGGGFNVDGTAAFQGDMNVVGDINANGGFSADTLLAASGCTVNGSGRAMQVAAASGEIRSGLSAPAGQSSWTQYETTGFGMWLTGKNAEAQTGANAGANYDIVAQDDSGTPIGVAVRVYRDTMEVNLPNLPTSASGLRSGSLWNDAGVLSVA